MTKQEKIQEEYLKLGLPFNENIVFDNGWLKIKPGLYSSKCDDLDLLKLTSNIHSIRPRSLQGIENNNGWIKIENEDDLPKETTECWFKSYGELFLGYYNSDFKRFNTMNVLFNINEVTHCQPIVKPSLPIY